MLSRVWKTTVHDGTKICKSSFTCKKMHFFGHNINSVHASDDLQVFKIPYPLEDTSLKKLHGVRQCSRPQWCSSSMPTRFTSVAISSWTNILEQDHAHQPFHSFAHVHARRHPVSKHQPVKDATSARNHPTSDMPYLCNLQDRPSFTLPPINMEVKMGPSNSSYLVPFKKQSFSLFMFMGGRVSVSYPCFRSRLFRSSQPII